MALEAFKVAHKKLPETDGGDEAALMIGKIYLYGLREKSDLVEAVAWLKRTADGYFNPARDVQTFDPKRPELTTPIAEASMILAGLYGEGHAGVPKDPAQSRKYLERAAETGYLPASTTLGDLYHQGVEVPQDLRKAFKNYMDAAKFAHLPAMTAVARMYETGEAPGGPDPVKALAWRNEAAKFDDPAGLYALAVAYDRGQGVTADPERAIGFYKVSAVGGYPPAMAAIGTYFYTGEQVPRDLEVARGWFEQAALGADPDGMFNLAAMMARGEGGEADRVKAWAWLKIAESLGHPEAAAAARAVEARFTAEDRAGVVDLSSAQAAPPWDGPPGPDPEKAIDAAFVGAAPGGPPWWKVSKGEATVWIMGLPPGRTLETQRWNTAPLRQTLTGARMLLTSYSPWSRVTVQSSLVNPLPPELGRKIPGTGTKRPTFSDAISLHLGHYRRDHLTDRASLDLFRVAAGKKVAVATPPVRRAPPPSSLNPSSAGVGACVEAILADVAQPAALSKAAGEAWARGDVAGALSAPSGAEWACRVLWPDYWQRSVGFHTEAIAMALDMPGKVVAAIDVGQLVAEDGVLPRLRAMGLEVFGPVQPPEP
jgi:TPR repeat protein